MNKILKLGIDLDGVLARFENEFAKIVNHIKPGTVPPNYFETGPKDWDWSDVLTPAVADEAWKVLKSTNNWWLTLEPFEDNVVALRRFLTQRSLFSGIEVYYVTSRVASSGLTLLEQCSIWLDMLGLSRRYTAIIPVYSGKLKGDAYRALGVTHSIDDCDVNVVYAAKAFGMNDVKHKAFILDRPYNQNLTWPHRVTSMAEFLVIAWADFVRAGGGQ